MTETEKIKDLCVTKGITIAELERKCGFSNGYISGLKKGYLPYDRIEMVAKFLNVPITYFRESANEDLTIAIGDEILLIEAFRKENSDGILHTYAKLIAAMQKGN